MRNTSLAVLLAAVSAACSHADQGGVTVHKSGIVAEPRPAGCSLEVLQKPPTRPYYPLGDIESHVTAPPPQGAVSVVKPKACELGADAIIVNRNMVLNEVGHVLVSVTAVRWATPTEAAPEPSAATTATPAAPEPSPATAAPAPTPEEQHVPLNPREPKR